MSHVDAAASTASRPAASSEFTAAEEADARAIRARLGLEGTTEGAAVPSMEELIAMPGLLRAMHEPV